MKKIFFALMILGCGMITAQENSKETSKAEPEGKFREYFMVFLVRGENRNHDSATAMKIQERHLAHMDSLYNIGKLDIAGPFGDDEDVRGICIYNVKTIEEAKTLASMDPAVKAGRLKVIVRPWWSMSGAKLRE